MFQHAFRTLLYGMIGYAVMQAIIVSFWGIWALRFRQAEEIAENLEQMIRKWLDDSGLATQSASDPTWNFGILTTLPDGESIFIVQIKESERLISFHTHLAISSEHQAILKAMPAAYVEKLSHDLVLKVFLARMVLATQMCLSGVSLFSQLAIGIELTEDEFLRHIEDMQKAIFVARNTISLAVERAPRLVSNREIRFDERR